MCSHGPLCIKDGSSSNLGSLDKHTECLTSMRVYHLQVCSMHLYYYQPTMYGGPNLCTCHVQLHDTGILCIVSPFNLLISGNTQPILKTYSLKKIKILVKERSSNYILTQFVPPPPPTPLKFGGHRRLGRCYYHCRLRKHNE